MRSGISLAHGMSIFAAGAALERINLKRRIMEWEEEQNIKPGGALCHAWPFPFIPPYEQTRWGSYSRQQRRADERRARKGKTE